MVPAISYPNWNVRKNKMLPFFVYGTEPGAGSAVPHTAATVNRRAHIRRPLKASRVCSSPIYRAWLVSTTVAGRRTKSFPMQVCRNSKDRSIVSFPGSAGNGNTPHFWRTHGAGCACMRRKGRFRCTIKHRLFGVPVLRLGIRGFFLVLSYGSVAWELLFANPFKTC